MFTSDANVLLLDEPDNYLDIPAKQWMEDQVTTAATNPAPPHRDQPADHPSHQAVPPS
ncbi:MAG: hypothetical protein ACR2G2_02845 [Pseudonocardia sp.]